MAYQPLVDLRSGQPMGVEALLRWTHPVHGAIAPGEFIPVAEESDLIDILGVYALRRASIEMADLRSRRNMDLHVSVNLSARQLDDPALVGTVERALRETGLPPAALCMEITETALMRDAAAASRRLSALRDLGVLLAIDDFGTGYSSLAHLRRLPIDALKIDQSFVAGISESKDAEVIVTSIVALAHALDLAVIAEGVETADQLEVLRSLDCDRAQGYYIGRPVAATDVLCAS
jgi:EAL domain-containing protein (putative c-di-GMP-specific phosphodiesterase class I)